MNSLRLFVYARAPIRWLSVLSVAGRSSADSFLISSREARLKREAAKHPADPFVALSAILTGFDRVELWGPGLVETYADVVTGTVGQDISDKLWAATTQIIARDGADESRLETAVRREILASPMFGPIARNIIQLWY